MSHSMSKMIAKIRHTASNIIYHLGNEHRQEINIILARVKDRNFSYLRLYRGAVFQIFSSIFKKLYIVDINPLICICICPKAEFSLSVCNINICYGHLRPSICCWYRSVFF